MKQTAILLLAAAFAAGALAIAPAAPEPDWPQWQGPDRTGLSSEKGLLKQWPAEGPARLWSVSNLGQGYGSVAIKGDRIFVQGRQGGQSVVLGLNRSDGNTVWTRPLGTALDQDRGPGPRGTPTVEGDRVYALSENGDLACLRYDTGAVVWSKNILNEFKGRNPHWLVSESPLIDGDRLIVTPGGPGAAIVALDKMTGATLWTSKELSDGAGYASCVAADIEGVRTIVGLTAAAGVGVRASDGKLLWRYPKVANRTANVATPVVRGDKIFYTTAYGTGCALLDITGESADEVYFSTEMMNHHGGVVLVGNRIYGFSNDILVCLDFDTGKSVWRNRSVGKGSLTYADGHLYLFSEKNVVALAEATPDGYSEKGRFTVEDQGYPSWAHPVVCGGKLYIRNQGILACYDVRAR